MREEKMIFREEKVMLNAHEVAALVGCSVGMAYKIIRDCNRELAAAGKITMQGKVNKRYLAKKLDVSDM